MLQKHRGIPVILGALTLSLSLSLHAIPSRDLSEEDAADQQIPLEDVQRFSNAISLIKKYYVKETDDKVLFDNAIRGMLAGLDPHSTYLDENDFKELQSLTNGEFGGLGIEVTLEEGVIRVITPLVDTPAFKAGIKAGDYIVKIDKHYIQGLELRDAVNMMRGKPGSEIKLTVIRKGNKKPLVFNIVREKIEIKSDGTPWRPVVHVQDVCGAFIAGLEAPLELVEGESFNVGIKNGNYTVKNLAIAAQETVPGCSLVFTGEHGRDARTYKVSFKKILSVLKAYYNPEWDLVKGGRELVDYFEKIKFSESMFRGYACNRLIALKSLLKNDALVDSLRKFIECGKI